MCDLDQDRVLSKIDELDSYLRELNQIAPDTFQEYQKVETRRACERLMQLSIEVVIDICNLFVSGLRLGLPTDENDLFDKLEKASLISKNMKEKLMDMRGFRNIIVHEYAAVDDRLVFEAIKKDLSDFREFEIQIKEELRKRKE